jgi:hypothetical protein
MITAELFDHRQLRAMLLTESGLAFVLDNPASGTGGAVIYVTDNPDLGKLDLTIVNNSPSAIEIGSASVLKIFVRPPLADAEVRRIKVTSTNWSLTVVEDHVELWHPASLTIASNANLTIQLADVMTSGEATTSFFRFEYSGFKGIADGGKRVPVFVQHPPTRDAAPLSFDLGARPEYSGQQSRTIYVTAWNVTPAKQGIANRIVLQAGNSRPDKPIAADPRSDSKLVISFTTGNSDLSLCLDEQIKVAVASMAQAPPAGSWIIRKDPIGPVAVWTMRPPAGPHVFDAGGMIAFRFDGIVSQLPPDFASPMFIQFANIPGYNDGYVAIFLQKASPVPFIRSFDLFSGTRKLPLNPVVSYKEKITLGWDIFAAENCRIVELGQAFLPAQSTDVIPAASPLTYTLSPEIGGQPYQGLKLAKSLSVSAPAAQLSAASVNVLGKVRVVLSWNCSNGSYCELTDDIGSIWALLPLTGSVMEVVDTDTTFTIKCFGVGSASAQALVEVPAVEATIRADCKAGEAWGSVKWDTRWASSCEVSEPGFETISANLSGDAAAPWAYFRPLADPTRIVFPGQPRWVRSFRIVARRKTTVVKEVFVTDLKPVAEA